MGDAIGPVGQLFIGARAAIADQRGMIAKTLFDHAIGQLDADIQPFGIVETVKIQHRPALGWWQAVTGECVDMAG